MDGFREAIPDHIREGIDTYWRRRLEPGSFVRAVLENDLMGACNSADPESASCLFWIVGYLYNNAPAGCHGSPEAVSKWLRMDDAEHRAIVESWDVLHPRKESNG